MEPTSLEGRIRSLERIVIALGFVCVLLSIGIVYSQVSARKTVRAAENKEILRVRGLIVEDDQGRARVLIGSPFPSVPERLRKDAGGTTLVFLDEQGHDRFRVGEMLPASPGFHRIGAAYGAQILDTTGGERGGLGFLSNGRNVNRAVIALDRVSDGSVAPDAWGAMVDDANGFAGSLVMYPPQGDHDQDGIVIGTQGSQAHITFKDTHGKTRSVFAVKDSAPSFTVFDTDGKPIRDLLGNVSNP